MTRGLFRGDNDNEVYKTQYDVAFFFVSYMLLASIMMLNVVVAILLDEFISTVSREKEAEEQLEREKEEKLKMKGPLDAVTKRFLTFQDEEDLDLKINQMFYAFDCDDSGGLTFDELRDGLREMIGNIHFSLDDFQILSENGRHLGLNLAAADSEDEFDMAQFRQMMKGELWRYSRRQLANVLSVSGDEQFISLIVMLKLMETHIINIVAKLEKINDAVFANGCGHTGAAGATEVTGAAANSLPVAHSLAADNGAGSGAHRTHWSGTRVVHDGRAAALLDPIADLRVALEEAQKASKTRDKAACQCVTSLAGRRKNGAAGEIDVDDDVAADVAADVADELGQALAGAEAACNKIAAAARLLADDQRACGAAAAWLEHVQDVEQAEHVQDVEQAEQVQGWLEHVQLVAQVECSAKSTGSSQSSLCATSVRPPASQGLWGQRQPERGAHKESLAEATQVASKQASQDVPKESPESLEEESKASAECRHASLGLQRQMEALTNLIKDQHIASVANHSSVLLHLQVPYTSTLTPEPET